MPSRFHHHHSHGLDPQDLQLLNEEWQRYQRANARHTDGQDPSAPRCELSPVMAVLPQLIRLVRECPEQSVESLRPTIKRLVLEQLFIDVNGDSVVGRDHMVHVKEYIELIVRVLIRIRRREHDALNWTDSPTTPQMFG